MASHLRPAEREDAWWSRAAAALVSELATSERGLDTAEAERRLARWGSGELRPGRGASWLGTLVSQLRSPLVLLLVVAAVISAILLNNFLSDVPQSTVAGDRVDREVVERPGGWDVASLRSFMIVFGLVSTVFDVLLFAIVLALGASVQEFRTVWFVESLTTELGIAFVVRTWQPFWRSRPSRGLVISTLVVTVIALLIPYAPFAPALGMVPLAPGWLLLMGAITVAYLLASELVKHAWVARRRAPRSPVNARGRSPRIAAATS